MSARAIVAIISFCVGLSSAFLGNMFIAMMIGEINRKRSQEKDLISYFAFTPSKVNGIFREYRSPYPHGDYDVAAKCSGALVFIAAISFAIATRILG